MKNDQFVRKGVLKNTLREPFAKDKFLVTYNLTQASEGDSETLNKTPLAIVSAGWCILLPNLKDL